MLVHLHSPAGRMLASQEQLTALIDNLVRRHASVLKWNLVL